MLTDDDRFEMKEWNRKFLANEVKLIEFPAWIMKGDRCSYVYPRGRCTEPVSSNDLCYLHTKEARGLISPGVER